MILVEAKIKYLQHTDDYCVLYSIKEGFKQDDDAWILSGSRIQRLMEELNLQSVESAIGYLIQKEFEEGGKNPVTVTVSYL